MADSTPASDLFPLSERLPDVLPADPLAMARAWLDRALADRVQANPNAVYLATVGVDGRPSLRAVLCKDLIVDPGYAIFYTNLESRKAREIAGNPRVALLLHWDAWDRQVRIEGVAVPSPAGESDAYFATRSVASRIGAWASEQSRPIESRAALMGRVARAMVELGVKLDDSDADVPRPPTWGGFRVWAEHVELWVGQQSRVHDRARWSRTLTPSGDGGFACGSWASTRLQP
jgi:pyridoxamine 5'-phosphate oxidase